MQKIPIIKNGERIFVYGFAIISDVLQVIFSFFVVTAPINNLLDFIIGGVLLIYGIQRKILDTNKSLTILAVFIGEQIPFVNALPFWTYDVYNLYKGIPSVEQSTTERTPGVTPPRNQRRPYNDTPGVRPPRLGGI